MAGGTLRFIEPGIGILGDLGHGPMTIGASACQPFLEHGIPQTLGLRAWMTLITAIHIGRHLILVFPVHGLGEIGQIWISRFAQRVGSMAIGAENRPVAH